MLKYVKQYYDSLLTLGMYMILFPLSIVIASQIFDFSVENFSVLISKQLVFTKTLVIASLIIFVPLLVVYFFARPYPVYLVNFSCYQADQSCKCSKKMFMDISSSNGKFTKESLEFQNKVLERSGLGESTYLPEALLCVPPNPCFAEARMEAEAVTFGAIDGLIAKTKVQPKDIGILVVNCSLFNPSPSLSEMIINRYKLQSNIINYNLAGMGCSAGLISIDLAKRLLGVHLNSYALVVNVETATLNWYNGNDRSMLVSNCLFRMGGAAVLLSNKKSDKLHSKYELVHSVRTHKGADDKSFSCINHQEDSEGNLGISLSKDLMSVASDALRTNITTLGPLVLPLLEQVHFIATLIARDFIYSKTKLYTPDFKLAFEHFCIHSGGKAVLDGVQKNLQLSNWQMEPSRMTLYRFGNCSSSSVWYELAYTETKGRVQKGDRIWQIAFGSGFKCNSTVWRALRKVNACKEKNPWIEEIHLFPVEVVAPVSSTSKI